MFRNMLLSWLMVSVFLLCAGTSGAATEIQMADISAAVTGQTIQNLPVRVRLTDITGATAPVDVHIGIAVPGGGIYELNGRLELNPIPSDPVFSQPIIKNIAIPAGTDTGWITLLDYQFTGNEPIGTYTVFGAVTETGTYKVLSSDIKSSDYTPPSNTPLPPAISLSCVGVTHYAGYSYIWVCVNLMNVPASDVQNLKAMMGKTDANLLSNYEWNSDHTYLTRACGSFKIDQYGSYNGAVGITTNGGTAAVSWDINVTSAAQQCN